MESITGNFMTVDDTEIKKDTLNDQLGLNGTFEARNGSRLAKISENRLRPL